MYGGGPLARIFHELPAATADMSVLPGVLGYRTLRRTVKVRLGFDFGFGISDLGFLSTIDDIELTDQISPFALWFSRAFQQIFNPHFRIPQSSTRWHTLLHGLATSIREVSGLARIIHTADKQPHVLSPCLSVSSVPNNQVEETLLNIP